MPVGFTFDVNKCVGCQACSIACSIENHLGYETSWRQIITYNPDGIENMPHYHLSLACNHCEQAVCIEQCPAKAIYKNEKNGIVLIDEKKCVGCKFCSWVCPYDAPTYNDSAKVMTKCTLCSHRLAEGHKPACVSICPTDALNYDQVNSTIKTIDIAGFPFSDMKPAIQITGLNFALSQPEQIELPYSKEIINNYVENKPKAHFKISLKNEWSLVLFSWFIAVLGGLFSSALLSETPINPYFFVLTAMLGLGVSSIHLGKKWRAYRALINWRASWLSREILCVTLFIIFSTAFIVFNDYFILGYTGLILVIATAFVIDMVYQITATVNKQLFHSAQIWLTLLLFVALFNHFLAGIIFVAILKLVLYVKRKYHYHKKGLIHFYTSAFRIAGLIFAVMILFFSPVNWFYIAAILLLLSELVDRTEFYVEMDIITPERHMEMKFNEVLKR